MTSAIRPRHQVLVIVRADCRSLIPRLRVQFSRSTVIVDRRRGDRRSASIPVSVERRGGGDRRRPLMDPESVLWHEAGYRIVYRTEPRRRGLVVLPPRPAPPARAARRSTRTLAPASGRSG
jgi:hypothetical protein